MRIVSLWQQAYIKGAKWYRGETAAGQWDTYKMAVDTVARGAVEATGMQIQFIFTLIPDKHICYAQNKTDYIIMWSPHCVD